MRIRVFFETDNTKLPFDYQRGLQAFIYSCFNIKTGIELHGTDGTDHMIKPFVFSNMFGKYKREADGLVFDGECSFLISSHHENLLEQIFNHITTTETVSLYGNYLPATKIIPVQNIVHTGVIHYRTISPTVIYQTNENGIVHFLSPMDDDYVEALKMNVMNKYSQTYGEDMNDYFNFYMVHNVKKQICKYKEFYYDAFQYDFKIDTTERVHELIQDLGLGSRNAAGFGMVEVVKD